MKWNRIFNDYVPLAKHDPLTSSVASSVLPAVINTVGNLGASLFGQSSQKEENQKNRDFALEMWNKQNEYNSPKNQMKLLREGGLNPYLFGDDAASSAAGTAPAPSTSPLPTFQNPVNGSMQLLQQGLQVESNVELQKMKQLQTLSDIMINLYKEGGQKQLDVFMRQFAPMFDSLNWNGSHYQQMFDQEIKKLVSDRYNTDMDSLNKDLQYRLGSEYSSQQIKQNLSESEARIKQIMSSIDLNTKMTDAEVRKKAAEIILAGAQAWNLQKQGDLYVADAKTVNALRDSLVKQTDSIAGLRANELYHSNVMKESNSYVYGYLTSDKGKRYKANYVQNSNEWTGSDFGFAIDRIFGDYIKIGGSASANYSNVNTYRNE